MTPKAIFPILFILVLGAGACRFSQAILATPTEPPVTQTPTETSVPPTATDTPLPASPTPQPLPVVYPTPGTVALDFVALACDAHWTNNSYAIACPGNLNDVGRGYIASANVAVAEGSLTIQAPLLVGLPAQGGTFGGGLFGRYPTLKVQSGDTFHATLGCQEPHRCSVEFALEYYDGSGVYHGETGWSWRHAYGGGLVPVQVDLSPLAGQSVDLVLVVRDQDQPQDDWVLWLYPFVSR